MLLCALAKMGTALARLCALYLSRSQHAHQHASQLHGCLQVCHWPHRHECLVCVQVDVIVVVGDGLQHCPLLLSGTSTQQRQGNVRVGGQHHSIIPATAKTNTLHASSTCIIIKHQPKQPATAACRAVGASWYPAHASSCLPALL